MAKLEQTGIAFSSMDWQGKLAFMTTYLAKRHHDLTAIQDFNLKNQAKTKSTKAREPKEKKVKKPTKEKLLKVNPDQLSLLKKLGLA